MKKESLKVFPAKKRFDVDDRVIVHTEAADYHGKVVNVSEYRPPKEKYAIDLDVYKDDYVFVGEDMLEYESTRLT